MTEDLDRFCKWKYNVLKIKPLGFVYGHNSDAVGIGWRRNRRICIIPVLEKTAEIIPVIFTIILYIIKERLDMGNLTFPQPITVTVLKAAQKGFHKI